MKLNYIVVICLLFLSGLAFAQPVNDDCNNATLLTIPSAGFGLGLITTPSSDLTSATIQLGEPFYSSLITAGNDKKSIWYKFTLPVHRGVNIELKQPGNAIPLNAAGFTLFKASSCMPALTDIGPALLTPLNQFGSSYNPCLKPGDYYIQVSSRLTSNGPIYLDVTLSNPGVLNSHDLKSTRYNFGVVSGGWSQTNYDVGCLTIDNAAETCTSLGANFAEYTQSAWFTFTTDAHVDLMRMEFGEMLNTGNHRIGWNVYQGDCFSNPTGLVLVDGCNVTQQTNFWAGSPQFYWTGKNYLCFFQPNTTYTIQVFYQKDYVNNVGVRLFEIGQGPTEAPIPSALASAPGSTNVLGTLLGSPAGVTTNGNDFLACNSRIINNACGTVNPSSGTVSSAVPGASALGYQLNTWYTFTTTTDANVRFNTNGNLLKRLFAGDVQGSCNLAVFDQWTTGNYYEYKCLPAGTYSLQILGTLDTVGRNAIDPSYNDLAATANLGITVITVQSNNQFSLTGSSLAVAQPRVYTYNTGLPLVNNVLTNSTPDTLGCLNTVLPAGVTSCSGTNNKAIYRRIVIGSDGILTLGGGNYYFQYRLFRGDAQALANSQTVFSPGQTITGLIDMLGCQDLYWSNPKVCVTPGVYTLVSYGDNDDVGIRDLPWVRFNTANTLFFNPTAPNNMGTVSAFPISGAVDVFSCIDNPLTIAGQTPCSGRTKQIYREFFLATPQYLNISSGHLFSLFSGQVSAGTASSAIPGYGVVSCVFNFYANINACNPVKLPAGWYTVVSYGSGGTYGTPAPINGNIGETNNINLYLTTPPIIPAPIYNRPFKAYVANSGLPIVWGPNTGTSAYPLTSRSYTFGTETFNCQNDLPFSGHPITACSPTDNRTAYYVFTLSQESYVRFTNIPASLRVKIFNLDVKTNDSLLMPSATPIQPCISLNNIYWDDLYWYGDIELCKMQPGTYTMVLFANDSHINTSVTPICIVEKVESSRFDHAQNAYDFANVPGDNILRFGKVGDTNPLDAGRAASNDFFSCTTGAQPNDPANFCWDGGYQLGATNPTVPYPMPNNTAHYPGPTTNLPIRRNLWYTFAVTGPGIVTVEVRNKTTGQITQYPWSIWKSDVNASLPWTAIQGGGLVDSTLAQGLTLVPITSGTTGSSNISWYCQSNSQSRIFTRDQCAGLLTDRYYILVDHHSHLEMNNQVEVGIKFEALPVTPVVYDYYAQANVVNGLGQTAPPYTSVPLVSGNYSGAQGNFSCATRQSYETNACGTRTLWYRIDIAGSGRIRVNATISAGAANSTIFNNNDLVLYRMVIPGDSTSTGLVPVLLSSITAGGLPWGEGCMNPGTYYLKLTGCNYTIESAVPNFQLLDQAGDLCSNPIAFTVTGATTNSASVVIDCHSIGTDFGEDGSNMSCLFGPAGYKSSWYRVTVDAALKMDVSFQLSESTTAFPNQIRYRVLFGTCGAMTAGPCNTDALTEFTLACMPIGITEYYIQIVEPINATGSITLSVTTTVSPDQTCSPINPTIPVANFTVGPACDGQSIQFTNQSSQGAQIAYLWDFGHAGATSTAFSPSYTYPTTGTIVTYNVTLTVSNTTLLTSNFVTIPVTIYPQPSCNITIDAPNNGTPTPGNVPLTFNANVTNGIASPATLYSWSFGNGQTSNASAPNSIVYPSYGTFPVTLTVTNGTCPSLCNTNVVIESQQIFGGGINDGAGFITIIGCPIENIFAGGINDGAGFITIIGCPIENIFAGGINDGAGFITIIGCPIENIFAGGINDGAGFITIIGCPIENIFAGGINDGSGLTTIIGCPIENIFAGGINDGSAITTIVGCFVGNIFAGGFNDGAGYTLATGCPVINIYAGGFYDGSSLTRETRDPLDCAVVLPVDLLSMNVKCIQEPEKPLQALLTWWTQSEQNSSYFVIERSNTGLNWEVIGSMPAAGQSAQIQAYGFIDPNPYRNETYYRIKQVDLNGAFVTFPELVLENCIQADDLVELYPNPSTGNLNVNIVSPKKEVTWNLVVTNSYGAVIFNSVFEVQNGYNLSQIDISNLAPGLYNFAFTDSESGEQITKKIVKQQ